MTNTEYVRGVDQPVIPLQQVALQGIVGMGLRHNWAMEVEASKTEESETLWSEAKLNNQQTCTHSGLRQIFVL
jgi:hypothetical protein